MPISLIAIAFMLLAFPVIFFAFTQPANVAFRSATPESIPANWEQLRYQWEYSHLARFFCHLAALGALVLSVLVETPARYLQDRAEQPEAVLRRSSRERI